jgi:hypothetical protein
MAKGAGREYISLDAIKDYRIDEGNQRHGPALRQGNDDGHEADGDGANNRHEFQDGSQDADEERERHTDQRHAHSLKYSHDDGHHVLSANIPTHYPLQYLQHGRDPATLRKRGAVDEPAPEAVAIDQQVDADYYRN